MARIRMVVYSSVLFNRGGNVNRWANSLERAFTAHAIEFAPVNKRLHKNSGSPGQLKASIRGSTRRVAPHGMESLISVGVPYATFVLRGTGPIIAPGKKMGLPDNSFWGTGPRMVVSGQKPTPFLGFAAVATGRTHSSVRGWFPS